METINKIISQDLQFKKVHEVFQDHKHIIKWTRHIGFLTLAGMARVEEGNHGNYSKRKVARILCFSSLAKFDYSLHFYFYERKTRQMNACVIM